MDNIALLLSDAHGQYIPRDFAEGFDLTQWQGIDPQDIETIKNPDDPWYWDAWHSVLCNATYTHSDGRVFTLHQDGDLWAICIDHMTVEELENFGFEDLAEEKRETSCE